MHPLAEAGLWLVTLGIGIILGYIFYKVIYDRISTRKLRYPKRMDYWKSKQEKKYGGSDLYPRETYANYSKSIVVPKIESSKKTDSTRLPTQKLSTDQLDLDLSDNVYQPFSSTIVTRSNESTSHYNDCDSKSSHSSHSSTSHSYSDHGSSYSSHDSSSSCDSGS